MSTYKIRQQKEAEVGFTVTMPTLPGCVTYGEDLREALTMAREAIELYTEELKDRGEKFLTIPTLWKNSSRTCT